MLQWENAKSEPGKNESGHWEVHKIVEGEVFILRQRNCTNKPTAEVRSDAHPTKINQAFILCEIEIRNRARSKPERSPELTYDAIANATRIHPGQISQRLQE